jgi:putative ATP-binding cassette transporter
LIGRALIGLDFHQQRFEADFRFNLVRVRESSEQIALLGGEPTEQKRLSTRFDAIAGNWFAIMSRQKLLTFFTASYNQASHIFPYLVVSPAYFAGGSPSAGLPRPHRPSAAYSRHCRSLSTPTNSLPNGVR